MSFLEVCETTCNNTFWFIHFAQLLKKQCLWRHVIIWLVQKPYEVDTVNVTYINILIMAPQNWMV